MKRASAIASEWQLELKKFQDGEFSAGRRRTERVSPREQQADRAEKTKVFESEDTRVVRTGKTNMIPQGGDERRERARGSNKPTEWKKRIQMRINKIRSIFCYEIKKVCKDKK